MVMLGLPALAAATATAIIAAATTTAATTTGGAGLVAIAAIDGPVIAGLERNLGLASAACADRRKHFPWSALAAIAAATPTLLRLASGAAIWAAGRGMSEPPAGVKGLLPGGEHEILTTIAALQCLVAACGVRSVLGRHET